MSLDELNVPEKKLRFRPTAKVFFSSDSHIEELRNEKSKMSCESSRGKSKLVNIILFNNKYYCRQSTKLVVISQC